MTLLPRTLLWRSVRMIALVLAVAHLAWLQIFRVSQREPPARRVAQQIVSVVNLTRAALVSAQPGRRVDFRRDLAASEGIQVFVAHSDEVLIPPPDRPVLRSAMEEVRRELGPDTRFAIARNGAPGFWVSFRIDEDEYWVVIPRGRIERVEPLHWVYLGGLVLLLSLGGAFLNPFPAVHVRVKPPESHFIHSGFQGQEIFPGGRTFLDLLMQFLPQNFFKRKTKLMALAGEKSWTALILTISSRAESTFSEFIP